MQNAVSKDMPQKERGALIRAAAGLFLALGLFAPALPGPAEAATVQWSVGGAWVDVDGGDRVAGVGNDRLSWGGLSKNRRSEYVFDGRNLTAEVPVPSTQSYDIGTFTHRNYRIPDDSGITGARLRVNVGVNIEGQDASFAPLFFDFDHWETDNRANPCANGQRNRQGVNGNGCADRVTILSDALVTNSVTVAGVQYLIRVSGFFEGDTPLGEFWTRENADNVAVLRGEITAVPLPAAAFLLIGGIGGLGLLAARRRR